MEILTDEAGNEVSQGSRLLVSSSGKVVTNFLLFNSRRALHEVLVRRVTSGPCIEADSVRVSRNSFPRQQAVDLSFSAHAQLIPKLPYGQRDNGLI